MITTDELDSLIYRDPEHNHYDREFIISSDYPIATQLSLGVEFEVELDEDSYDSNDFDAPILAIAHDVLGSDCMDVTEDGSLECGAEFRSKPMTVLDTIKLFRAVLDHEWVKRRVAQGDLIACRSTGLHVHVGTAEYTRDGSVTRMLSNVDFFRLIMFLNDDEVHDAFHPIYERSDSDYARKRRMANLSDNFKRLWADAKQSPDNKSAPYYGLLDATCHKALSLSGEIDKYRLVNVNTGRPTIEFRMFRNSFDGELTQTRIELCNALVRWVRGMNLSHTLEPKLSAFKDWVLRDSTQQTYGVEMPQLTQFIRSI